MPNSHHPARNGLTDEFKVTVTTTTRGRDTTSVGVDDYSFGAAASRCMAAVSTIDVVACTRRGLEAGTPRRPAGGMGDTPAAVETAPRERLQQRVAYKHTGPPSLKG